MALFDHFDFLAPIYETFIPAHGPDELMALVEVPAEGALLDAGGGTGRVAQYFVDRAQPVVVADLSRKMLAEARAKTGLRLVCTHTEILPFPDASFARIIMGDALHHVIDQRRTLDELWRVLRPGGRMVVEEPDARTLAGKVLVVAEKVALMRSHFLTPPQIAALLQRPDAHVRVIANGFNARVVAEKAANREAQLPSSGGR